MWQGIQTITDYKQKASASSDDISLPDKLNKHYARFDDMNTSNSQVFVPPLNVCPPFVVEAEQVRKLLSKQNPKKASGPDNVSTSTLRNCSQQLAPLFTDIFNTSLESGKVPLCFKSSTIVPVPKKSKVTVLNDYRPVALTSVIMKVFERIVMQFLRLVIESQFDPLQFAYRANRSVDDAVSLTLHNILQHLESAKTYSRVLFLDFSSAFNTIHPLKLYDKLLNNLKVHPQMCNWILDFLLNRPQVVRLNGVVSKTIILNTGAPQGCVLSPLLFTIFTNDCRSTHDSVLLVKFSDDTTVTGLISDADETVYRMEVEKMVDWCKENDLVLNVTKTKELIVDFRKKKTQILPLIINNQDVEIVDCFKFLGTTISRDLGWVTHVQAIRKKAQQRLYFLRQLKKFGVNKSILVQFYRAIIESVLSFSITTWYGNTSQAGKDDLHRVVKTASKIIGTELPNLNDIYKERTKGKAKAIMSDNTHPSHHLFQSLPHEVRFRSIMCKTERFRLSCYPNAIRTLNGD